MMHLAAVGPLVDVGRSLREAFFMFWETLWALVLGFTLSGFVQAFVSKEQMQAKLGNHRPAAVGRAAGYGMVSSSCSYAASAMAKSLFAKGADFTSAMIFLIASTNLVVELGIVLLVLLGWQFMVAEFVGGPIMIILLAIIGGFVFRSALVATARRRAQGRDAHAHDHGAMAGMSSEHEDAMATSSWSHKVRSPAAWSDAAGYAVADVTMLQRELVIGYVVAGFLAVLVPAHLWNVLFIHGHGFWTTLENSLVGPIIAVLSWVCSIGNVPLAAALWSGGISFGGVISFIFADLIAMPLILIYRKFYGPKLTLRLVGVFYVLMAAAGLITQGIFRLFNAVPATRNVQAATTHMAWNYTTYLDIPFIILAVVVWWTARNKERFGGGVGYAIDPICGMQVRTADAPATAVVEGMTHYFCSDRCLTRFNANAGSLVTGHHHGESVVDTTSSNQNALEALDPVCGMTVTKESAAAQREHDGVTYYFCGQGCAASFEADPSRYINRDAHT
jgi:YHS domain-containing protein/uncharacterized membrane protein YraQ (UPF0718 family)